MLCLDGGEHGVDPACLTVALILHGGHAVQHLVRKVQRLIQAGGITGILLFCAACQQHQNGYQIDNSFHIGYKSTK